MEWNGWNGMDGMDEMHAWNGWIHETYTYTLFFQVANPNNDCTSDGRFSRCLAQPQQIILIITRCYPKLHNCSQACFNYSSSSSISGLALRLYRGRANAPAFSGANHTRSHGSGRTLRACAHRRCWMVTTAWRWWISRSMT